MKEATGELNMTVITVVAIAAIAAIVYMFVWPSIQESIIERTCRSKCPGATDCTVVNAAACGDTGDCFENCVTQAGNAGDI